MTPRDASLPDDIRVVFFDYGDTLVHIDPPPDVVWQDFLRDVVGTPVSLNRLHEALHDVEAGMRSEQADSQRGEDEYFRLHDRRVLGALGVPAWRVVDLVAQVHETFTALYRVLSPFPETLEVLSALRQTGFRLGVISNATDHLLERLAEGQLDSYFESVTYSEEVGSEKPQSHIFRVALERMGCTPGQALHVGDRYDADVVGAQSVGITPVLIDRRGIYSEADCLRIQDLRELLPFFPG